MNLKEHFNPKKTSHLIGYNDKFNFLNDLILKEKLPKVLMLTGDKGIGKATLIFHLLHNYFSHSNYDIKNNKILSKNSFYNQLIDNLYPNIDYLSGEDFKNIKIDEIRKLKNKLMKTPLNNNKRFIILDDVEVFNINCLNALLKIIEEPGKNNYFILINNKTKSIIQTLYSRCIDIKLILGNSLREQITSILLTNFDQKQIIDDKYCKISPGNFLKYNYFFFQNEIDVDDDFSINVKNILSIYKKEKSYFYKDLLFFLSEYNLIKKRSEKIYDNQSFISKRSFIMKNINDFFLYNLNQKTLLNSLEGLI